MLITYTAYQTPSVRHQAAIQDIKAFVGPRRFNEMNDKLRSIPNLTFNNLRCNAEYFLGIKGFCVVAWARELGLEVPTRHLNDQ